MSLGRGFQFRTVVPACVPGVMAAQLTPATISAWERYIQAAESRLRSEPDKWMDQFPDRVERLRGGDIVAAPTNGRSFCRVPHGLVHDWTGAVFIPTASIADVLAVLRDYDLYARVYAPTVRSAELISRDGDRESYRIRYLRKALFATVVLDIEYNVQYRRVDEHRWFSTSVSTWVRHTQDYGQPGEHALPADDGSGFVWRAFGITRLDERDGGVYLEQNSIALSRTVPFELRWLVEPFVERLSQALVTASLRQTRDAVLCRRAPTQGVY